MSFLRDVVVKAQELRKVLEKERDALDDLAASPGAEVRAQAGVPLEVMDKLRSSLCESIGACSRLSLAATRQMAGGVPPVGPPASESHGRAPGPVARAPGVTGYVNIPARLPVDAHEREAATRAMEAEPDANRLVGSSARMVGGKWVVETYPDTKR